MSKRTISVEIINPFIDSLVNVLSVMAQLETSNGKPFLKKDQTALGDVSGLIGLMGDTAKGSLAISLTDQAAVEISSRVLMESYQTVNADVVDMVGELTNMVSGGAKRMLAERGYKFSLAIPTMLEGKGHIIKHKINGPVIVIPFETDLGDIFIEVCLVST